MKKIVFIAVVLMSVINIYAQKTIFDIARNGNVEAMKEVLQKDSKLINSKSKSGFTPLILASYRNNINLVSFLIKQGAQVDITSEMGTALMAATYKGNTEVVKILLENGADPNRTDLNGTTALHYACLSQNVDLVKMIKTKNPKIDIKDNKGKTALDYAIILEDIEIIKLLRN